MVEYKTENHTNQTAEQELSLKDLFLTLKGWFTFLLSKWLIIFIVSLLGGFLGYFYAYYSKTAYTATTTFVLEEGDSGGGLGQYAGLAAVAGLDFGGGGGGLFQGDNIIELYKSRKMIQKALLTETMLDGKKTRLIDRYLDYNEIRESWERPELKSLSFADSSKFSILHDSIIGKIVIAINKKNLTVSKPDKKLSILKVEVISGDELFAKSFNNLIVSTVNNFYVETKTKKSLDNVRILKLQTDSVMRAMSGAIYSSAATLDATPNLNPTRQILRAPVQRSQFSAETNKLLLSELVKNLELSRMALRKETPLIQIIDEPILPLEWERLGKLKGLIIGALVAGFLCVLVLVFKKVSSASWQDEKTILAS